MTMKTRKKVHIATILGLTFFMLTQYQNCAPPKATVSPQGDSSPVDTIDEVQANKPVFFAEKAVNLHTAAVSLSLDGVCSQLQDGSTLGWYLYDANAVEVANGSVACVMGGFHLDLEPVQNLECDKPYRVVARYGVGAPAETLVTRACH